MGRSLLVRKMGRVVLAGAMAKTLKCIENGLGHPSGQYLDRRMSSGALRPKDLATYGGTFAVSGQGGRNDDQCLEYDYMLDINTVL